MRALFRIALAVSAMALAAQGALAQAVTTFDGTYGGVSLTTNGGSEFCTVKSPVPGPLMISGGNATTKQGDTAYQGSVNAQGALSLHTPSGTLMYGKIDASGTATAGVTIGSTRSCTYNFAWKKR